MSRADAWDTWRLVVMTLGAALAAGACGGGSELASPPAKDSGAPQDADVAEHIEEDVAEAAPPCVPKTCEQLGASCGSAPDGCGGKVECGACQEGASCGGGGVNVCGTNTCTPRTCTQLGASCGYVSDTCGVALNCGHCPAPQTCGGGGIAHQCGCHAKTCGELEATCGTVPDGCEGTVECGACPQGQSCGAGNRCADGDCSPRSCAQLGASCGLVSDGCGKVIDCGACAAPGVCGGLGVSNQCGCLAKTCGQLEASCGTAADGCQSQLECGTCPAGTECGAGSVPNQCSVPEVQCGKVQGWKVPGKAASVVISSNTSSSSSWYVYPSGSAAGVAAALGAQDDARAVGDVSASKDSKALQTTGYGFGIPAQATITGVAVRVLRATSGTVTNRDLHVRLLKAGTVVGDDKADTTTIWPLSSSGFGWKEYGAEGDTWGASWTPADINASGFGFELATHNNYSGGAATAYIDVAEIRVFYCE